MAIYFWSVGRLKNAKIGHGIPLSTIAQRGEGAIEDLAFEESMTVRRVTFAPFVH